ncbi:hypothetical protein BJ138DRAFT_1140835 [Hygrophoropsis aurantiaca]|uniref:Uncharacterized protein n=1 Tax=Hygrophoropsis aurantiaca TaxID=72124 RepID=A0ACB8AT63_9AGAM|nr:hypothetical protein BJ138DRAFT_1140835 [Hygrophoropsis aurantiaca]
MRYFLNPSLFRWTNSCIGSQIQGYQNGWNRGCLITRRQQRTFGSQEKASLNVDHSRFIAESSPGNKWRNEDSTSGHTDIDAATDDVQSVANSRVGKVAPTSSHLFKFILPLGKIGKEPKGSPPHSSPDGRVGQRIEIPPIVMLLHPSQPLSHAARLIAASLPSAKSVVTPNTSIIFRSTSRATGQTFQWSDSTGIGDFIKEAARDAEFAIHIGGDGAETVIRVEVPKLADRTRFLRRRLDLVNQELTTMEELKRACDKEARRGGRRMALGGFGMLVTYWATVARLTFWDYGWDIMEPVTYLSGLSTVICGYLWFLYQGREVSYTSVLDRSISSRREALYKARGFDIERWMDLGTEAKNLRREIRMIAEDYDESGKEEKKHEGEVDAERREKAEDESERDEEVHNSKSKKETAENNSERQ